MEKCLFIFAFGLLIPILSVAKALETVWLKDVTTTLLSEKRTLSNSEFPNELAFRLTRRSEMLELNLRRNNAINPNPNFYFARKLKNGQSVLVKSRNEEKEDVAYYQDIKNGAFMTVRCVKKSTEECDRTIRGNVRIGDRDYDLQPANKDVVSRKLEDPGHLGRQYVLEAQTHTKREYSLDRKVWENDRDQENDKNVEQKYRSLLRRFEEQHTEQHIIPSDATFSSRIGSILHNRAETDKSRQLTHIYYVNFAVLIDSALWNLYTCTVHSYNLLTRSRSAIKRIKQVYSHVLNGVNMLYKGIEDPSISINIFLNDFFIFKSKSDLQHHDSRVVKYNGTNYIDVELYHNDVVKWDKRTDNITKKYFGHGMLFTRYTFFLENLSESTAGGSSYIGDICMVGRRMSVLESGSLLWMVHGAAHELGHSLGAYHDGEGTSAHCDEEDEYIMTPERQEPRPDVAYNANHWIFSHCSVEAFKVNLKNKTCLSIPGPYYDHVEYNNHVMKQAGEVFSTNEQCELINGPNSALCETPIEKVCLLMRCTDPKTGICLDRYYGAGRGTECGRRKWCINGLCVPRQ